MRWEVEPSLLQWYVCGGRRVPKINKSQCTLDSAHIHEISNHPVHIFNKHGVMSPSAFIPFCGMGGNSRIMGEENPNFDNPVCNSFKPKLRNGQLCYQVDPNDYKVEQDDKKLGLVFAMDYNFDRMVGKYENTDEDSSSRGFFKKSMMTNYQSTIYIELLGRIQL